MRIGEVAGKTGLSISNIRFYEKKGLLSPARETDSRYRDYSEEDIVRLKQIILYRKMNLSVEMIYMIIRGGASVRNVLERQAEELKEQCQMLQGSIDLCCRVLEEPDPDDIDIDYFLNYVKEEEQKGSKFAAIEEILDEASEFYGFVKFRWDPWIGSLLKDKWIIRGITMLWLLVCMFFPVAVIISGIVSEGKVSGLLIFFCCAWYVLIYPFLKYLKQR